MTKARYANRPLSSANLAGGNQTGERHGRNGKRMVDHTRVYCGRGDLGVCDLVAAMSVRYDRLTANPHPNDRHEIGTEDGETCGRYPEPDEDQPRGYKRKPCEGVMVTEECGCCVFCDTCWGYAND